jgi:nitric oxide reductase NorD protein
VPSTLRRIRNASTILSPKDLDRWLTHAYDLLDSEGIGRFIDFISRLNKEELQKFTMQQGLHLKDVSPLLEIYLRGISGLELKIAAGNEHYTDTASVFLPHGMDRYEERDRNFLVYKLMVVYAWAQITQGSLIPDEEILRPFLKESRAAKPDIGTLFGLFPERELAAHMYSIIEAIRLEPILSKELPGLMSGIGAIKQDYLRNRPAIQELSGKSGLVEGMYQWYLSGDHGTAIPGIPDDVAKEMLSLKKGASLHEAMGTLLRLYEKAAAMDGLYQEISLPFPLMIKPGAVLLQLNTERRRRKQKIDSVITKLLAMPELEPQRRPVLRDAAEKPKVKLEKEYLLIKGRMLELDSELREALEKRGGIPGGILVKGADMGGQGSPITLSDLLEEAETTQEAAGGIPYDEWDYKRSGYKKAWCTLYEKDIHPGHEPFVEKTLRLYSGTISILRKKFELLRREPEILRRQKEGDDIDIDAVVEAFSDMSAGLSPGENLFTRYDRQERDIAALFLLDMSGSTKGWILEAEKEALVLMAEALETLGDRYAVYGFSGMTRNKCDFYLIKSFEELYVDPVKRRISGILPKDYTRMGPPIRHATSLLGSVKARTKLLITLSDGRPEDYDAYKGLHGIEDTRKALIEAKEKGIHSFCITIDRDAGSYIRHMYGEVNYIVIDDVRQLPHRITEIYRRLTT